MVLRDYQTDLIKKIYESWQRGNKNVLLQLPTGAGKTFIFTKIMADFSDYAIAIAHRSEIVCQISLALARWGIKHNLLVPSKIAKEIIRVHVKELGTSFFTQNSKYAIASVDSLLKKTDFNFNKIRLVIQDEAHHVLIKNKWGKAASLFPNAIGLYPTATPIRADGYGLGRFYDGIMDDLISGPSMRYLIEQGYLTDYKIFCPPSDINLINVKLSANGDYNNFQLRNATHESHITGDVVEQYLKKANGKLGVTFAVDIKSAIEIANKFKANGVNAEVITSKTPDSLRYDIMKRFKDRQILQLVNVDLLGEGVDVPALEVVSMARATQSFALYAQQFGRALRPLPGKDKAIIIDHVGNVMRHNVPDCDRTWSLASNRDRTNSNTDKKILITTCKNCFGVYARILSYCPYCQCKKVTAERSTPEQVDGDLTELNIDVLTKSRERINRIDGAPLIPHGANNIVRLSIIKNHKLRQESQFALREVIANWAGIMKHKNYSDAEIYKLFFINFGVDIATAQTLNTKKANELKTKLETIIKDI